MRAIDADALDVVSWKDGEHGTTFDDGVRFVLEKIDKLPTIEPERTGRWIEEINRWLDPDIDNELALEKIRAIVYGAKMEGEECQNT